VKYSRLTIILGYVLALLTMAAPLDAANPPSGQGLELSPPLAELKADPGQSVSLNIRVRDVAKGPLNVTAKADDFTAKDEQGTPQILFDETEEGPYSLKFWVAPIPAITLVNDEVKTMKVTINVPKNAEPGGHFGVIRFTAAPPGVEGSGVALSASVGTLVLLNVSGNARQGLDVVESYANYKGMRGTFFEWGPIGFTERLRNSGTVHVKPTGTIDLYQFGRLVHSITFADTPHNVLPGTIRKFDQSWSQKWLFGPYTAKLNVQYGDGQHLAVTIASFWVIPWRLILLVIIVLVGLFFILRSALRRYNRQVIERAKRSGR
jgi:hypothetical protein